jgi:hypothetical protein
MRPRAPSAIPPRRSRRTAGNRNDLDQSLRPTGRQKWRMAFDPKQRAFNIQLVGFIVVTLSVAALVALFFAL